MRFVPRFVVLALLVVPCLPAAVPITITSNPAGLSFEVDGGGCNAGVYTTPQTLNWTAGASCTVTIRSAIRGWQDGTTSNPRTIVTPSQATTYSAISTLALPPAPGNYGAIQISTAKAYGMNNYGQVVGNSNGSAFLWTPVTANGMVGSLVIPGDSLLQPTTAAGINDRGQVVGSASTPFMQAILWTPDAPNGTSGTAKAFLGGAPVDVSTAIAINSFGQIAGINDGNGFIWTPTSPNGNAGTINQDSRFGQFNPFLPAGFLGINDFGQAITNADPSSIAYALFTPAAAHGATGTFTPVYGVPGFTSESLNAINSSGTILGSSCTQSNCVGFIWTPAAANGATGTVTEISVPPGYVSLEPTAMNSSGQVVGRLLTPVSIFSVSATPFLYSGGTLYDLSTLGNAVANGTPAAINDRGQIVFNTSTGAYLATPGAAPDAPGAGSVAVTIAVAFNPPPTSSQHVDLPPFTVVGTGCNSGAYIAPQTLYWVPGSSCTVNFPSLASMQIGARSLFQSWQDGPTAFTRVFVAPAQAATYTGVLTPQYLVTTAANPPGGGTVSGGGWYTGGSTATLNATPASGYRVLDWSPSMVPVDSQAGTVTVYAAQTVTVNFEIPTAPAPNYLLTQMASYFYPCFYPWGINSYGQVVGQSGWLWTPVSPNSPAGSATAIAGLDSAGAINDVGQVVGSSGLWTPDTPNGTSGSVTPSLGGSALNNYGQIAGGFLWTPSSPNATTGTFNNDPRFAGARLINDFGQVVISAQNGQAPTLFTPSVANGTTGTFTPLSGLPADSYVTAINRGGTILGAYNNISQTFLWIPTTANGTTGSVVTIPPPPSYLSMTATALNAGGQVVGTMRRTDGVPVPFLYSGGTVYDLSNISPRLTGATPIAINDHGQILLAITESRIIQ